MQLLSEKVNCSVINAGDGSHEHPTQALLDALTIRRRRDTLEKPAGGVVRRYRPQPRRPLEYLSAETMGARVRLVAPKTLLPAAIDKFGVDVHYGCEDGIRDADIIMMLRLQRERMEGSFVPSTREYFRFYGLDREKLSHAKPDALIMHPGPMNRGVEIDSELADDIDRR